MMVEPWNDEADAGYIKRMWRQRPTAVVGVMQTRPKKRKEDFFILSFHLLIFP